MSWHVICLTMRQINGTCVLIRSGKVLLTERSHRATPVTKQPPASSTSRPRYLLISMTVTTMRRLTRLSSSWQPTLASCDTARTQNTDIYIKHTHIKNTWCSIYLDSYHRHCNVSMVHVPFQTNPHLVITLLETHKKFPFQSHQLMCRCGSGVA